MLKFEREECVDSFVIGFLSQRLDGMDGLTSDEWIAKAKEKAENTVPGGELPNPGIPDEYWKDRIPGTRG